LTQRQLIAMPFLTMFEQSLLAASLGIENGLGILF
jgi:hypothetical protein